MFGIAIFGVLVGPETLNALKPNPRILKNPSTLLRIPKTANAHICLARLLNKSRLRHLPKVLGVAVKRQQDFKI